ncbi:MAG: phytanoyl-CoA dioxygenase family protein [Alphaproteobacteria bacterium]|nr:phytanoyl-CoA dioxygenase family protein [Alphaproteobacteria bacterium]
MTAPLPDPEAYARDGFVAGVPVLDADEVADVRARFEALEAEARARHGGSWSRRHHFPWETPDHPFRSLFHELATHPRLLAAVRALLGPDVLVRNADVFVKEPGVGRTVAWHLDTAERDGTEDGFLTAWLGLGVEGATADNGGLRFLRGGHRLEIPDRPRDRHHLTLSDTARAVVTPDRVVQSVMAPGRASLHHALMPHFSGGNRSAHRRIAFVVRYLRPDVSPAMAESGQAMRVAGQDRVGAFTLTDDFPVTWTPQLA